MSAGATFELIRLGLRMAHDGLERLAQDSDERADPRLIQVADAVSAASSLIALCEAFKGATHA